ncbi:MAG: hypothetical protein EBU96_11520 [Actinobacteria bacterium]|nr:hypothetical protein [Actinomycetota bacterium]
MIAGTVTVGNSVTISSLPAISGTVEVNQVQSVFQIYDGDGNIFGVDRSFPINGAVDVDSLPSIVGTVTANLSSTNLNSVTIGVRGTVTANIGNSITVGSLPVQLSTTTIGGTARLNVTLSSATTIGATAPSYGNLHGGSDGTNLRAISVDTSGRTVVTGTTSILGTPSVIIGAGTAQIGSVTASISGTVPVSGTLTALSSTGTITSNYNSNNTITTAGLAQLVANANTSRKYFVIQNISDTAMYLGVGYTPTTSTGLLLSANGGGMVFDGSFIPTEAVRIICSTAGKSFVAWEGS